MVIMFGIVIFATIFHGITRSMKTHNSPLSYVNDTTYINKAYDSNPVDNGGTQVLHANLNNGYIKRKDDELPEETGNGHIVDDTIEDESKCSFNIFYLNLFSMCTGSKTNKALLINVREYRRDNQKRTIQRNWQHKVYKTKQNKTQTQHNISWTPHTIIYSPIGNQLLSR
jgi:hypothetical protein